MMRRGEDRDAEFVDRHRSSLIQRVTMVMPIADALLQKSMIHAEHYSNIQAGRTSQDKMRELYRALTTSTVKSALYRILQEKESFLVQDLEGTSQDPAGSATSPAVILTVKGKLKKSLKRRFRHLLEGITQEEKTLLNHVYTELYITEEMNKEVDEQHEIVRIQQQLTNKPWSGRTIHFNDIFKRNDEETKVLMTKGIAGIGKTVSVQKFIKDWAEGVANQDIDLIFVLPFRELNAIKCDFSLQGLLKEFHPELNEIEDAEEFENYQVLFILDGMDESKCPLDFQNNERVSDVTKKCPVDVLLTNIMKKNLLPSALLWITSRPAAASQIDRSYFDKITEIRGFTDEQKDEYFRRSINNEELATKILSYIKTNMSLYTMCYIPIMCRITSKVLEDMMKNKTDCVPTTLTEMYIHFLIIQTGTANAKYHGKKEKNRKRILASSEDFILKLAKLAFQELEKGNLEFPEEDLRSCGIDVDEATLKCGLCTEFLKKENGLYEEKMYCFVHLSFQEFLAALYVFYCCVTKNSSVLESFLENVSAEQPLHELLKRVVDKALQSKNGHLDLFLRFLLGLSLESNQTLLQGLLPQTANISETDEEIRKYLKKPDIENMSAHRHVNLFLCLTEMKDHSVHEDINQFLASPDRECFLSQDQCLVLANAILMSQGELDEMDQRKYNNIDVEGNIRLIPAVRKCRKVVLSAYLFNFMDCATLASILQSPDCLLRDLHLWSLLAPGFGDEHGSALRSPHCKLETLRLTNMYLRYEDLASLASSLQSPNCRLRGLHLWWVRLRPYSDPRSDLSVVLSALRGPHCKLETLRLADMELRYEDSVSLASSLHSADCPLRVLHLEGVNVFDYDEDDHGDLSVVFAALSDPHCELKTLRLIRCFLTENSCRKLSLVLRSNYHLRELDLSHNDLKDSGVKLLSDGLKSRHCRLEILRLSFCGVTEEGCASLASALSSNHYLRELDLSYNHPGDTALSGPLCRLEKLNVDHNEEIWIKPQLLKKYACYLTLDPNTAHRILFLSEDNRSVNIKPYNSFEEEDNWRVEEDQSYPDHPERFDDVYQVLCNEGLTGCHYWEVEGDAQVGVTYRSIRRRGRSPACTMGNNERSWCLGRSSFLLDLEKDLRYFVRHNQEDNLIPGWFPPPRRVGVYLDWPAGVLSFYSISSDAMTHLYTFNTSFSEPLYPGFKLSSSFGSSLFLCQVE